MLFTIFFLSLICGVPLSAETDREKTEVALFAGGCFWSLQCDFDRVEGVVSTAVGYTGGSHPNPSHEELSSGDNGYVQTLQIVYNPKKISYEQLVDLYWHRIDPSRKNGQFCDLGPQYRPIIFYRSEAQKKLAEESKLTLSIPFSEVAILPATPFYPAEEWHQEYYKKNPIRYQFYRSHSGRDKRLKEIWSIQ